MINLDTIPLYCIHLPKQKEREDTMIKELNYFRPNKDYIIYKGKILKPPYNGISESFKSVVGDARLREYDKILIFEDDIKFASKQSKTYFQKAVDTLPDDWDIVIGVSYDCDFSPYNDYLKKINNFTSLICVMFNKSAYQHVLDHDTSIIHHMDKYLGSLSDKLNIYLVYPMIAMQYDNYYSDNRGAVVNYSDMLKKYEILKD